MPGGAYRRRQLEVDFVANKGAKRYYIQSAYLIPDDKARRSFTARLVFFCCEAARLHPAYRSE